MSGPDLTTTVSQPWVVWQPLTLAEGLTLMLGVAALGLATYGLWQMRVASEQRNRQLDARSESLAVLTRMLDDRTAAQSESLAALTRMLDERTAALTRSLETVIEQTAPLRRGLETVIQQTAPAAPPQ